MPSDTDRKQNTPHKVREGNMCLTQLQAGASVPYLAPRGSHHAAQSRGVTEPMSSDRGTTEKIAFALRKLNPSYLYQQLLILSHSVSSRESKDRNLNGTEI